MFADALAEDGFSVWWDASLHSGETFDEVIERNLREAGAVVVLWSPRSVASRWVRAEATLADRRNKLVPAIIEPCDRPIIFELTHAAELADWTGDITDSRWQAFVSDLRRLVDARKDDEQPATKPQPSRPDETAQRGPRNVRQPLRPGSNEVILAGEGHRSTPVQRPARSEPRMPDPQEEVHCLEVEGGLADRLIVIESSGVRIGRAPPADFVLSHQSVSREHCIVGLANDELLVTDLNSTNGTDVDGVRIGHATILPVGSVLKLGEVSLKHSIRPGAEASQRNQGLQAGRLAAAS
jgi:hypothetical protein